MSVTQLFGAGRAGQLPGFDELLAAPDVDRLLADVEISGDLGDTPSGGDKLKDLAAELGWVPLGTVLMIFSLGRA
jgi:hypothetical protein